MQECPYFICNYILGILHMLFKIQVTVQFDTKVFIDSGPGKRLSFDSNINIIVLFMM